MKKLVLLLALATPLFLNACVPVNESNPSSTHAYAPTTTTYSEEDIESAVIDTCQKSVKQGLRDPDSAKFSEWKAWIVTHYQTPPPAPFNPANGDKYYSAGGMVNAKNGFGGYTGNQAYACDASVTTGGNIHARSNSLDLSGLGGN